MITEEMKQEAWQSVKDNFCGDCRGGPRHCENQDTCEGFQQELKETLEEWEADLIAEGRSLTEEFPDDNL